MEIESRFDGGSIIVPTVTGSSRCKLLIPPDNSAEFRQWFCFRVKGEKRTSRTFAIMNAGEATYPDGFEGYRVVASYDERRWFRVPTTFDGEVLEFVHTAAAPVVTYSYFAPYSLARHNHLLKKANKSEYGRVEVIGKTPQDRDMSLVILGEESPEKKKIWITARQHPGETMAEWFMEGLILRLLDDDDETVQKLLQDSVFYLVPNMNPDGSFLGNLRTNGEGVNLNRMWTQPDEDSSPEVLAVRQRLVEEGVDLFLDIHGDERNPYCFLAGNEGNPGYNERIRYLENLFEQSLLEFNADFQDEYGYPRDEAGEGDLTCASNWVGETHDCLAFTVEMPFKDNDNAPDELSGWSPERSKQLGESVLDSIAVCLPELRLAVAFLLASGCRWCSVRQRPRCEPTLLLRCS